MDEKEKTIEGGQLVLSDVFTEKSYPVVKANALIQNTIFDLSALEQKLINYAIQKIKPDDEYLYKVEIHISDFCRICNVNYRSGSLRTYIKETILNLANKGGWIRGVREDGVAYSRVIRWVEEAVFFESLGLIVLQLNKDLSDYLIKLNSYFTSYEFSTIAQLKSKYGIRLYELFKSYENMGEKTIDLDDLKKQLQCSKYNRWADFKRNILDMPIAEINSQTDLQVSYTPIKNGRKVIAVSFSIHSDFLKNIDMQDRS